MVSTRVLSARVAVIWAAVFNFVAFLVFGTVVAATIATGVVDADALSIGVVFAGLIGAIGWNLITFYLGLPTSSSHTLVGGIAGATVAKGGFDVLVPSGLRTIGVFIILSPLLGLALGMLLTIGVMWAVHRYRDVDRLDRGFRVGQLFSAAAFQPWPRWQRPRRSRWGSSWPCSSRRTIAERVRRAPVGGPVGARRDRLGHAHRRLADRQDDGIQDHPSAAGRRDGRRVGATATLFFTSYAGIPVSTTHTITGGIVGVGASRGCRRSGGAWPDEWCGPGSSPSRARG